MSIKIYTRNNGRGWGHPSDMAKSELAKRFGAAQDNTPHGLTPQQIETLHARGASTLDQAQAWWDSKAGSVWSPRANSARNALLEQALPPGRAPEMKRSGQMLSMPGQSMGGGQGSSFFSTMRPYQPEFESPDRQMFPIHRRIANTYWRLFAKMDPVIASVVEMFAWLPWGDFQLTGEGVDGEVKEAFEYMVTETKLRSILPFLVSEFLIVGEVIPHLFFDDAKGIWTHIALHNPDQVNVVYSPFIHMDTIMEFVPDPKLRELVTTDHPMLSRVRETMPPELVSHLRAGQNIPLSPVNATFIPRKLHPYDLRGSSIITRLWRTLMLEDAIWSATIQTARRASSPLKVAKLGDPTSGTIPPPSEEKRVLQLLAQAELDPQAWLVYNYQIQFDLAGAPERIMSINQHYDLIERIKLVALGVSKAFVSGETSYSAAASGLTVFLQRLKSVRDFFVNEWLIPKYFLPVAVINEWIKPSKMQASGGHVRVKRSAREIMDERRYIIPTIEWAKSLDPQIDKERIDAMTALEQNLGIKITDQKKYAAIGLDPEEEQKQLIEELKFKRDLAGQDPAAQALLGLTGSPDGGGGGGAMLSPGIPPEISGMPPTSDESLSESDTGVEAPTPEGASITGDEGAEPHAPKGPIGESKHWSKVTLDPLIHLFESFDSSVIADDQVEPWTFALKDTDVQRGIKSQDSHELWLALEQWLIDEGYTSTAVNDLKDTLTAHGKVKKAELVSPAQLEATATQLGVNFDDTGLIPTAAKTF